MGKDKNISIEPMSKSIANGFGSLTIPSDVDRHIYLKDFYRTGLCMLITTYNEIKRQVKVPIHLIDTCIFPQLTGDMGSLVHWTRIPGSSQLVVTGLHLRGEEFGHSSDEKRVSTVKPNDGNISVTHDLQINGYSVSVQGSKKKPGEILLRVSDGISSTSLLLSGSGITVLEGESLQVSVEDLTIIISDSRKIVFDEDEIEISFNTQRVKMSDSGVEIETDKIISLSSRDSSISVTDSGVTIDTKSKVYLNGSHPVLFSKVESATEILDVSQIGVSKTVRVG